MTSRRVVTFILLAVAGAVLAEAFLAEALEAQALARRGDRILYQYPGPHDRSAYAWIHVGQRTRDALDRMRSDRSIRLLRCRGAECPSVDTPSPCADAEIPVPLCDEAWRESQMRVRRSAVPTLIGSSLLASKFSDPAHLEAALRRDLADPTSRLSRMLSTREP